MGIRQVLTFLSGILFLAGFVPYAFSILKGKTKPAKASWVIWVTLDTITLAGMMAKNSVNGQIVGAVVGGWLIVALALKYGVRGWTSLDRFCLGGALGGVALWVAFNSPVMGLSVSVSIVFLGSFPTFVSAWRNPNREDKVAWTLFWISCVFAVVAIPKWTLQDAMQPITFFLIESTMMYLLYIRHKISSTNSSEIG